MNPHGVVIVLVKRVADIGFSDRAGADVAQLLRQFENIVALAPVQGANRNTTAVEAYQMEVETAALVRAAEDILSLTRSLKEAWLFGQLDTVGESKAEAKTEAYAKRVVDGLTGGQEELESMT